MIRILVADDHPVVREGIRRMIASTRDMAVAAEASNGRELLESARTVDHDLVLLDLSMPEGDGLDALKQLKLERPTVPVLVLTMYAEHHLAIRTLKAGAAGYVVKGTSAEELIAALRRTYQGGRYISPAIAEELATFLANDNGAPPHHRLSDREYQVLRMIASGRSTRDIASALSLSIKTVSTYRARVFEKMQMKTTAELATYVIRNNLAD